MRKRERAMLMRNCSKAQSAIELLILLSFFLLFSIPLISLMYLQSGEGAQDASLAQARQACREIAESADSVYAQGNETNEKVTAIFPPGLQGIRTSGREIVFTVHTSNGNSDVVAIGIANMKIRGEIGTTAGPHVLLVRSLGDMVEIEEGAG
jgi:hypothetical protein